MGNPGEEFRTQRLVIRPWTRGEADVDRILDIYSRWEVARWLGAAPRAMASREEAEVAVDRWAARADDSRGLGVWAVEVGETATVAGTVLLVPLPAPAGVTDLDMTDPAADIEVGWHFHPDSWGNGYATEAARAVLARGFVAGLEEIFAVVRPGNDASAAVCRRLGMSPLGRTSRWYGAELDAFRATP